MKTDPEGGGGGFDYLHFRNIPLRSEREIMRTWQGDSAKPVVSVVCTAFNQAAYIEDALKGFLIQETTFPFEIIIHDDASTDDTAAKIMAFEQGYPHIIRGIYRTENQYSRGKKPLLHTFNIASGRYLAICQGDDYWISPNKLQLQYEAMTARPDIHICIHSAYAEADGRFDSFGFVSDETTVLPAALVVSGRGGFCATASIMVASDFAKKLPPWLEGAPVLDLFIQGLGAFGSGALYVADLLCVYRLRTTSSWTNRLAATYISRAWLESYEVALNNFDRETGGSFPEAVALQAAVIYYKGAISSIRFGNKDDFLERIAASYRYWPRLSTKQLMLYRFRHFFNALSLLYRLYKRTKTLRPPIGAIRDRPADDPTCHRPIPN